MNGPLDLTFPNGDLRAIDLFEVKPDTYKPGDADALEDMAKQVAPEREKRHAVYADGCAYETQLGKTLAELEAIGAQASQQAAQLLLSSADELISTTTACDVPGLTTRLRPIQDQCSLIQVAKDLLFWKRLPAARLRRLELALACAKSKPWKKCCGQVFRTPAHSKD